MPKKTLLRNVVKVHTVAAPGLRGITYVPGGGVLLGQWRDLRPVTLDGLGQLEVQGKVADGSMTYATTLTFHSPDFAPAPVDDPQCFVATCADGSRWLVGGYEEPRTSVTAQTLFPSKVSERAGLTVTVTLTDTRGLRRILD